MTRQAIEHASVHHFDAPYSSALRVGNLLFISGIVAVDEHGDVVGEGDLAAQTRRGLESIGLLIASAGGGFEHLVRVNYYLADIAAWPTVGAVRREFLVEPYPAGTAVEVARLVDTRWLIEIDGLAVLPS